jgi:hypothetical protein
VHFCLAANIIKWKELDKVINITEPLMNRINELITTTPLIKENQPIARLHEVQDAHEIG